MSQIIRTLNQATIKKTAARCKRLGITIPTFQQLRNPENLPPQVTDQFEERRPLGHQSRSISTASPGKMT